MSSSPSAYTTPIRQGPHMTDQQLQMLKTQLVGLRRLSDATGFSTNRLIVDMLSRVSNSDLILLGLLFEPVEGSR